MTRAYIFGAKVVKPEDIVFHKPQYCGLCHRDQPVVVFTRWIDQASDYIALKYCKSCLQELLACFEKE